MAKCGPQGLVYNPTTKKCQAAAVKLGQKIGDCTATSAGSTYFDDDEKSVMVCDGDEYKPIGGGGIRGLGETKEKPARSCQQLIDQGVEIPASGAQFFLGKSEKKASKW